MADSENSGSFDWNSEDDREFDEACLECNAGVECEASEAESSSSAFKNEFLRMGFTEVMVLKAIQVNGENAEQVLDMLLTLAAIGDGDSSGHEPNIPLEGSAEISLINLPNDYDNSDFEVKQEQDSIVSVLMEMGYSEEDVLLALNKCGPNTPIDEIADFIGATQMVEVSDNILDVDDFLKYNRSHIPKGKKRRLQVQGNEKTEMDMVPISLPNPMIGYGVPGYSRACSYRRLPDEALGPPYFYYENVALAPKGVWAKISSFLYEVLPEFVDSSYITAANRKRGYIHNLPISHRFPLMPLPPKTIHEALPTTREWWPSWDRRTKLNCLQTCIGSAKLTERIQTLLSNSGANPPLSVQEYILEECRRWNLVWVGKNKLAPLEPDEMEFLQGYPKDHTRGVSRTERYKALGNTFQIDTVAYHLSVLKEMYPNGMNVLSLFSGIGGAEVALHKLGIPLKTVVSVEISEINRQILRSWWDETNQQGTLIEMADVQQVTSRHLDNWSRDIGGFDLIIGGSPCNNLAGSNRYHRNGLEGEHSSLFYEYFRILEYVRSKAQE